MSHQFDELAKALAEGVSRREALRRIGGGLAGALLVSLGWTPGAWGATREACEAGPCSGLKGKAKSQCMSVCRSCASASCVFNRPDGLKYCLECQGGKVCASNETCQCPSGTTDCGALCADTTSNRDYCGNCSTRCGTNEVCNNGTCECDKTVCPRPTAGGTEYVCSDTDTDPANCGVCGMICSSGACISGRCACQRHWSTCGPGCCAPEQNGYPLFVCEPNSACPGGYNCRYGPIGEGGNTCVS